MESGVLVVRLLRSCFVPRYTRRLNDVSLNKKHLAVFVYGSTYGRRLAIPVSRQASSVKLPAQSCCASSANHLSFSSFVALLFFFSSVLLSIRGCLQSHITAWYTYMHTSAYRYTYAHIHLSRVVTYGDRYRVPLICHEVKRLLLFVSFPLFIFLSFPFLCNFSLRSSSSAIYLRFLFLSVSWPFPLRSLALFYRGDDLPTRHSRNN